MQRYRILVIGLVMTVLLVSQARAAESGAIALLTSLSGKVEIKSTQTSSRRPAQMGDQLFENDILQTHKNAKASLLFSDGSIVNIFADTRLTLSLKEEDQSSGSKRIASLSKDVLAGVKGIFSKGKKKETLPAVPGFRKKVEKKEEEVKVLYPRNSAILTTKPVFHWQAKGERKTFNISLTLKGMGGKLWSISTDRKAIVYPTERDELGRGQTYFLRVESEEDAGVYDEIFFRILDERKATEVKQFADEMENLRTMNPDDMTPLFVLTNYYRQKGLHHEALTVLDDLEKNTAAQRFVLEQKMEIFFKLGLWKKWEEANQRLSKLQ